MAKKKPITKKAKPQNNLTFMQEKFVNNLVKGMTQEKAYIKAGYASKAAMACASRMLRIAKVKAAVKKRKKAATNRAITTRVKILEEYARIAFLDPRKFFHKNGALKKIHELDDDTAAALASMDTQPNPLGEITKKIKFADKINALNALAKMEGLFEKDNKQKGEGFAEGLNNLLDEIDGNTVGINGK
jgi:phage terminase small subunit